jgi:hypothetical protein
LGRCRGLTDACTEGRTVPAPRLEGALQGKPAPLAIIDDDEAPGHMLHHQERLAATDATLARRVVHGTKEERIVYGRQEFVKT